MKHVFEVLSAQASQSDTTVRTLIQTLLDRTIGNPYGMGGALL
jgi:hypothetical protein